MDDDNGRGVSFAPSPAGTDSFKDAYAQNRTDISLEGLDWTPGGVEKSLQRVFLYVQSSGKAKSSWYRRKKGPRQLVSLYIRFASLVVIFLGGLCPLVPSDSLRFNPHPFGYLLLATGGGLFLFDKFFGVSSSWMRYMVAAQQIEAELERFAFEWLKVQASRTETDGSSFNPIPLITLASNTLGQISAIVQHETLEWVGEFQNNQTQFSDMASKSSRDGSLAWLTWGIIDLRSW